ncbi:MAG: nuclear transport factor 2 family protein, partial [Xanthomonadales bacterium]|nr:nuclear transport factor 2 family protein [Xanthomonadales bacterium]
MVICEEHLDTVRMIATNVFIREGEEWRMVHHQATRLADASAGQADGKGPKAAGPLGFESGRHQHHAAKIPTTG